MTSRFDLHQFIEEVDKLNELRRIDSANWDLEIGALTEITANEEEPPALLFDKILGYPDGHRIMTNSIMSQSRAALALGLPLELRGIELLKVWKSKIREFKPVPPTEVNDGHVREVIQRDDQVDLERFPAPKWHELDGGRYIGTGCAVITRDREAGWINMGTYRVQVQEQNIVTVFASPTHHARIMANMYFSKGEDCPVVMSLGHHPTPFLASQFQLPWGTSELDLAGYIAGQPVRYIQGEVTGLPIPADSEIVLEGWILRDQFRTEGPFGEFTGYYAGATTEEHAVLVERVYHRANPIILGSPPLKPPAHDTVGIPMNSAAVWEELEKIGVMGVRGVWDYLGLDNMFTVVSIKQLAPGHARQTGLAAISGHAGSDLGRFVIIVDDEIDPSNLLNFGKFRFSRS